MKRHLITALKLVISAGIVGYLVYDAAGSDVFANLVREEKHWDILAAAWAFCAFAALLTFVRWWLLVRALDVPCKLGDALRISFWGYLLNWAPLGIVGGDLFKAVMLDHEHPGHRSKAIAAVLVDRLIGLYILFVVASAAILATAFWRIDVPNIFRVCMATFGVTVGATLGLAVVLGPEGLLGPIIRAAGRIPRVGRPIESLMLAVRMYRRQPRVLIVSALMTAGVHSAFATGCFLIACGLPGNHPTLAQHFVIMPLSAATQVIPLSFGPTEFAMNSLYSNVPVVGEPVANGQGLVVAFVYRLFSLLIAAIGVLYYIGSRREVAEVMHEEAGTRD